MRVERLGSIARLNPPPPRELIANSACEITFLPMAAVSEDGRLIASELRSVGEASRGYSYFARGDILLAKITPCFENGKAADLADLPTEHGFGSTEFHVLRPGPELSPRYLFHLIRNAEFRRCAAACMTGSAGQKRVPSRFLSDFRVPLPPLPEQKRIAEILDKADEIRRKREHAIGLFDHFRRSVFLEVFGDPVTNPRGWPVKTLGELADAASGVTKGKKYNGRAMVTLPYMRVANVQDGHFRLDEVKSISVSKDDGDRYQLQYGDVLLTEGGDPDKLGRGAVWRGEIERCIHQNHIFRVRPGPEIRSEYLSAILGSERGKRYFLSAAKQTTGIASINMTQLKSFPVLVPPIDVQVAFGRQCEALMKLEAAQQEARQQEANLLSSLTQRAFNGGL